MVKIDDVDGGQINESGENIDCTTAQQNISNVYVFPGTDIVNDNN